jgi:SAM-dependent methyltransferase
MGNVINKVVKKIRARLIPFDAGKYSEKKIELYLRNGKIPWSEGYKEHKYNFIKNTINAAEDLLSFKNKELPKKFAAGIDERAVEYPWLMSRLSSKKCTLLDAGSTFNFDFTVEHPVIREKELTIYTFFPEKHCFFKNRINYVFGDLRDMYFKDESFDEVVSQSTIEHIDMDNSIYGYEEKHTKEEKSYEYLKAVSEMVRVLKPGGKLLLTFPFGKYENHGFFQQFDEEMLKRMLTLFRDKGSIETDYFKYEKEGWRFAALSELHAIESFNPHTGKGKSDDGAAHSRSIACIEFIKNK